jgi:large subunit ribosomal protein L18
MDKKQARLRRARRTRARIAVQRKCRLCVNRSPRHIYAQVFDESGEKVVAAASTVDKELRGSIANGGNMAAAAAVGEAIAKRAAAAGISAVAFDRSGYKFHGRVKALADAAREHGLEF